MKIKKSTLFLFCLGILFHIKTIDGQKTTEIESSQSENNIITAKKGLIISTIEIIQPNPQLKNATVGNLKKLEGKQREFDLTKNIVRSNSTKDIDKKNYFIHTASTIARAASPASNSKTKNLKDIHIITSINTQLPEDRKLSYEEKAALAHNIPTDQNSENAWEQFNTELDKILTNRDKLLNHKQLLDDLHKAEKSSGILDSIKLIIAKLWHNSGILSDKEHLKTRGYTIEISPNPILKKGSFSESLQAEHSINSPQKHSTVNKIIPGLKEYAASQNNKATRNLLTQSHVREIFK